MGPNRTDFFWSYIAQIISVGGGIIALPLVLKYWDVVVVNDYLILITLMALFAIIDGGLRINVARIAAFSVAGRIPSYGSTTAFVLKNLTISQLFHVIHRLSLQISSLGGFLIFAIGSVYIYETASAQSKWSNFFVWALLSGSQILFSRNLSIIGVLQGMGNIAIANKIVAWFKGGILFSCILSILLGFGLQGFAIGAFFCSVIVFYATLWAFERYTGLRPAQGDTLSILGADIREIRGLVLKPSARLWFVHLGGFLINRGNVLVAGLVLGVVESSAFMLSIVVISVAANLASSIIQVYLPQLNSIQVSESRRLLPTIVKKIYGVAYSIFTVLFLGIYFLGNYLLELIGSEARLIDERMLLMIGFIIALELNHSIAAIYLTTRNEIIFAKAAVLSGVATVFMGYALGTVYGTIGLILAQGGVQLLYNNWRWPQLMLRDLRG